MDAAVNLLCDTSKLTSFGNTVVARVIVSLNHSPRGSLVRPKGLTESEKGRKKGSEVKLLCDKFRVVRLGRANMLGGREESELWEISRTVNDVRSAKELGRACSLLLCN